MLVLGLMSSDGEDAVVCVYALFGNACAEYFEKSLLSAGREHPAWVIISTVRARERVASAGDVAGDMEWFLPSHSPVMRPSLSCNSSEPPIRAVCCSRV